MCGKHRIRRASRGIIQSCYVPESKHILLPIIFILHPTNSTTILSYGLFNSDLLSHCSSVPRSSLRFHPIFNFQSTNQSPAQFTSDSNLAFIAMLIPTASCSGGQRQGKKMEETKPTRHHCAVSQP